MKLTSAPRYRILSKLYGAFLTLELDSTERSAHVSDRNEDKTYTYILRVRDLELKLLTIYSST